MRVFAINSENGVNLTPAGIVFPDGGSIPLIGDDISAMGGNFFRIQQRIWRRAGAEIQCFLIVAPNGDGSAYGL